MIYGFILKLKQEEREVRIRANDYREALFKLRTVFTDSVEYYSDVIMFTLKNGVSGKLSNMKLSTNFIQKEVIKYYIKCPKIFFLVKERFQYDGFLAIVTDVKDDYVEFITYKDKSIKEDNLTLLENLMSLK